MTEKKNWGGPRPGAGRKKIIKDRVKLSVSVERATHDRLRAMAKSRGKSTSELVRMLVDKLVNHSS